MASENYAKAVCKQFHIIKIKQQTQLKTSSHFTNKNYLSKGCD